MKAQMLFESRTIKYSIYFNIFSSLYFDHRNSLNLQMSENMKNDPKHFEKHQTLAMFNYRF